MDGPLPRRTRWLAAFVLGVAVVLAIATGVFWEDLRRTALDPKVPFQTYDPPPAPNYGVGAAWWLMPTRPEAPGAADPAVDVFFVSPTVYDGGEDWNAPIDDADSADLFVRRMAPNYVGPFVRVGRIFAPRYRQASLYSLLTLREDAREARRFAYGDVSQAFRTYVARYNRGRPFIIVGVEQGGTLAARLLREEVALDPELRSRLVAAYLPETIVPADAPPIPPCEGPGQTGCLAAWASINTAEFERAQVLLDRALVWTPGGDLENLKGRRPLCFNPILSATTDEPAPARLHRGAANATDLEWGARPAFMARQVSASCEGGVLRVSAPRSSALKRTGSWAERRKVPGYNLFYADLEADAEGRADAFLHR
ncbi:DUF3089 domain-containing protein [Phenylobacterium sp. J367]|uniref:DUF3089 domain-containing protein n=1 Tax=Phenylobacterium sp. J367 TaxID=2898435 RepID=UPI0021512783|nr:DUF3089 domain-containing protein [Phenylobacterium sp. J367]MCR5880383.1 DUF3089 domain-containing protein [Phenylobacterium sp. J367]